MKISKVIIISTKWEHPLPHQKKKKKSDCSSQQKDKQKGKNYMYFKDSG